MNDLVIISCYCDTSEKKEILRSLVSSFNGVRDKFDIMIVSHTPIPEDIAEKSDYTLYDKKNELLTDLEMRNRPWFTPGDDREIQSAFLGEHNYHLAIWRMIILGNSLAKNLGYLKVHHLEYDTLINDFSQFFENSNLLDEYDSIYYDYYNMLLGSYQAYRLDSLSSLFLDLDEDLIKSKISSEYVKSPENMLKDLLTTDKKFLKKDSNLLFNNNEFRYSEKFKKQQFDLQWCVPYYDRLNGKLCFIAWNTNDKRAEIQIIYNKETIFYLEVDPGFWRVIDIDDYINSKEILIILNGKVKHNFNFENNKEEFKKYSFRIE